MPLYKLAESVRKRIIWVHEMLLSVTQNLDETQFSFQPQNMTAPSIAWHLWHIARWADRLQAGFSDRLGELDRSGVMANERWACENLALEWQLDPSILGVFEVGAEMEVESIALISRMGKGRVLPYAQSVFSDFDLIVKQINDDEIILTMKTTVNFNYQAGVPGSLTVLPAADTHIIDELFFHEGHASRHLGMIEALRGLMLANGTATV